MSIFNSLAKVTKARAEVALAREATVAPAAALIARGYEYPLTVLGIAAGSGVLLSSIKVNPLAVPGVSGLVAGGTADIIGKVISMAAGSFLGDLAGGAADATADVADEVA
ncbi:hypothetical protein BJI69_06710 [Luteibacter rhizovicinus DSM 16549]|uniref:Uncharacterized protein n=1 Tax=Luteibacter rhizovicinus DSM 16549 TaxID=1440763 RepID=A0A0G9HH45_9GAMM|nr:hypothetical protein [Luteibacter rhizovicinus]APG03627.1 hypothetical protein BJI69_06710 [Luteibacter rhizovicinus DSM 16549]KLD68791.1 hypothetical protein Y883_00560 [Luteibacter rhizovicinus DSM 16549]KLD69171.1 hypothetical protein Y886_43235 [Xanthomonas hyacinthi DSM 19077]